MNEDEIRGQLITRLREDLLWTREELAKRAGVTPTTVTQAETGRTHVRLRTLGKLADALGVPAVSLLRPTEEKELATAGKAEAPKAGPATEQDELPPSSPEVSGDPDEAALEEQRVQGFMSAYPSEEKRLLTLKRTAEIINGYTDRWREEVKKIEKDGTFPYGRSIEMRVLWEKLSDAIENDGVSDYVGRVETGRLDASDKEREAALKVIDALIDMFNLVGRMHEIEHKNRERAGEEAKELEGFETELARNATGAEATALARRKRRDALGLG